MRPHLLCLFGLLLTPSAQAIEKCITQDKRILYSDAPCPAGSKRVGGVEEVTPPDPQARQRINDEREQMQRELDRIEQREAEQRQAQAQDRAAEREAARRAEQEALMRRQTEALERLAEEKARQPVYVAPPYYLPPPRPHPHPPIIKPPPRPPAEEEKRYEMAPFPRKSSK